MHRPTTSFERISRTMRTKAMGTLLYAVASVVVAPIATAQPASPIHEVEFGEFTTTVDGEILSSFPATLKVHKGDVIHFRNELGDIPETGVHWAALLPKGETADAWMDDEGAIPDGPWSLFVADPDEQPEEAPAAWKANKRVGLPTDPYCGQTELNPCDFDGSGDSVDGVLTSGLGQGRDSFLDFYVRVTAEAGTELWALCPFHPTIQLRIVVVSDTEPTSAPEQIARERDAAIAHWDTKALSLHRRHATKQKGRPGPEGSTIWEAWPGLPSGPLFLVGMYPQTLRIEPGDYVRWHSSNNELHTVSFPMDEILETPWNLPQCDPDTDAGTMPDFDPVLPRPPYCPGGGVQLEIDLDHNVPFAVGDGVVWGANDLEVSGFRSTNYLGIERSPYVLKFAAPSGQDGFAYVCSLHPEMRGTVIVE